jgi:hypothetical protein
MNTTKGRLSLFTAKLFFLLFLTFSCSGRSSIEISFGNVSTLKDAKMKHKEYYAEIEKKDFPFEEKANYRRIVDSSYSVSALKTVGITCEAIKSSPTSYKVKLNELNTFMEEFNRNILDVDNGSTLQMCNSIIINDFDTYKFESAWAERRNHLTKKLENFIEIETRHSQNKYYKKIEIWDSSIVENGENIRKIDYFIRFSCKYKRQIKQWITNFDLHQEDYLLAGNCKWTVMCDRDNQILPVVFPAEDKCYENLSVK